MRERRRLRCVAVVLSLLFLLGPGLAVAAPQADHRAGDFATIDAYVAAQLRANRVPGAALAIVQGERVVHLRGFGTAGPDGAAATPDTLFVIGSMSKSITALELMQLVEGGQVALDAPVRRYLPWFSVADHAASEQITVRHLLTHRRGIPEAAAMEGIADDRPLTLESRVRELDTVRLVSPPGAAFHYANADYLAFALIIEAVSGQSYEAYVREHVLAPLEMTNTALSASVGPRQRVATGYRYWFGMPLAADLPFPRDLVPSGYIRASAEDLVHFLIVRLNGGRYGTGWWVGPYNGDPGAVEAFYHGGSTPQFRTYMLGIPEGRWGVVLLLNANSDLFRASLNEIPAAWPTCSAADRSLRPDPVSPRNTCSSTSPCSW